MTDDQLDDSRSGRGLDAAGDDDAVEIRCTELNEYYSEVVADAPSTSPFVATLRSLAWATDDFSDGDDFYTVLNIYCSDLKSYENSLKHGYPDLPYEYADDHETREQLKLAFRALRNSVTALEKGDNLMYLRYFYAANRRQIPILAKLDELDRQREAQVGGTVPSSPETDASSTGTRAADSGAMADQESDRRTENVIATENQSSTRIRSLLTRLHYQVSNLEDPRAKAELLPLLTDKDGSLRTNADVSEIDTVARELYRDYVENYETVLIMGRILRKLNLFLLLLLLVILVSATYMESTGVTVATEFQDEVLRSNIIIFYLFVVFVGIFGAVVSNLLHFYNLSADTGPRMPDEQFQIVDEVIYARILLGGAAAAFLYTVLVAGLLLPGGTGISPLFVLTVAFAAGFSDRLLVKTLDTVEKQVLM